MTLFGTAGVRGPVADRVTPELALSVGRALGKRAETVVIGRDGRGTGVSLANAIAAGVQSTGGDVVRIGEVPTPTLAYASRGRHGVMVTASHNPPTDNGIKLFADGSSYDAEGERAIESMVAEGVDSATWEEWGTDREAEILPEYRQAVLELARPHGESLEGMKVVVDCGNGVGANATPQVLREMGATVLAQNATVDGHFPARESKPTPESLSAMRAFVADDPEATVGIGHDGDADRVVLVDEGGEVVHEDTVTAILAEHFVRESSVPDPVVLTTPNTSSRIDERVEAAGGRVERVALGTLHEGIARTRAVSDEGTDVVFASEPWKGIFPELGDWIDGVATVAVLTRLLAAEGLDALRAPITERPMLKANVDCPDEHKQATMDRLETTLPEAFPEAEANLEHGVRLTFEDGSWGLVRPSGTEPYVRAYVESENVEALLAAFRDVVEDAVESTT